MPIYWDRELFKVDIPLIDSQHEALFRTLDKFHDSIHTQGNADNTLETLWFLEEYSHEHFDTEEKLMIEHQYPGLQEQQEEHRKFIEGFKEIKTLYESERASLKVKMKIYRHLYQWLFEHISIMDNKMGNFIRSKT